jgi:hypothetical protein
MAYTSTAESTVENSAQVLSCLLKFVHALAYFAGAPMAKIVLTFYDRGTWIFSHSLICLSWGMEFVTTTASKQALLILKWFQQGHN